MPAQVVGKGLLIGLIIIFLAIQALAFYGFLDFHWGKVGKAATRALDLNKDGCVLAVRASHS